MQTTRYDLFHMIVAGCFWVVAGWGSRVILAEPTAAIDPNAEHDWYDQFSKLSAHKTVLFITHRLASVTMADRVLFIADGCVAG